MKNNYLFLKLWNLICATLFFAFYFTFNANAQKIEKLSQAANGKLTAINDPVDWVTGNMNGQKAHYTENMTIPYQLELINLIPGNSYTVQIGWDTKKNNKHALDFLTSYDRDDYHDFFGHAPEQINPLKGTALDGKAFVEHRYAIPGPSDVGFVDVDRGVYFAGDLLNWFNAVDPNEREFSIFNGTLASPLVYTHNDLGSATASDFLTIKFIANTATVVMAWGANIASQELWGNGYSATAITGSPYHTFVNNCVSLSGCGNKEVQLATEAVIPPPTAPSCGAVGSALTCNGDVNGTIEVTWNGGTAPFRIYLNDGITPVITGLQSADSPYTISGLGAGSYTVRLVDNNNEETVCGAEVTQPDALDIILISNSATCFGGNMSISAYVSGTPLSDIQIDMDGEGWTTVVTSPVVFNGLSAGNHVVTIRRISDNSCITSNNTDVSEPDELDVVLTPTDASCYGGNMSISAAVTGTPLSDIQIDIDGEGWANVVASPVVFNGLTAGNHVVTIRRISDNSCTTSNNANVTEPDELDVVLTPTDASCYGGNMSISAAVTGTPLSDIQIDIDGEGWATVVASPVVFNGLSAGNHVVTIRRISDNSCSTSDNADVKEPDELDVVLTPTDASCYGGNMSISAAVTGTPLSDIQIDIDGEGWAAVAASPVVFNGLTAGNHVVTIRRISDNSCTVSNNADVTEPDELDVVLTPIDASCYGGNMSISAAVTGTPLSDIQTDIDGEGWATVVASPVVFNGLTAGNHVVTIRRISDNSCSTSDNADVTEPDELDVVLTPTDASCYGGNMSISAAVTGTPLSDIQIDIDEEGWANVAASPVVFNGLSAGNHVVTIRRISDNSCTTSDNADVKEPKELTCEITSSTNVSCISCADGSATVFVSGGTLPYSYQWNDASLQTTATATGLITGNYKVIVTDAKGCGTVCEVTINLKPQTLCTYTQGYYGNDGGTSCDGKNQYSTAAMIAHSINSWGGKLTIGLPGHSIIITNSAADVAKVIEYLPGGKGIGSLGAGDVSISSTIFKSLYTRTVGKNNINIDNILLAQTITLGLNLGIGTPLGSVELDQDYIVTALRDGGCGSTNPKERTCYYDNNSMTWKVTNEYNYYMIEQSILNLLAGDKTVKDLYVLANKALGTPGLYSNDVLTKIANAVDKINNAFDNCSILIGYMKYKLTCGPELKNAEIALSESNGPSRILKVYPNPFSDRVYFSFTSGTDTQARLEIYNLVGQKITTLMDQRIEKGVPYNIEYEPVNQISGMLFYRFTLEGKTQMGKFIYDNNKK